MASSQMHMLHAHSGYKMLMYLSDRWAGGVSIQSLKIFSRLRAPWPEGCSRPRAFTVETGQSPAKAIEKLRVEAARLLIEQGRDPIEVIAKKTPFADREGMRRARVPLVNLHLSCVATSAPRWHFSRRRPRNCDGGDSPGAGLIGIDLFGCT
jgi:hypothetical protein